MNFNEKKKTNKMCDDAADIKEKRDTYSEPANAAVHGPHSLVRFGPGCAGRA